jgi:exosortase/archaeosortase family protein
MPGINEGARLPRTRWVVLLFLLVAEALALGLRYDGESAASHPAIDRIAASASWIGRVCAVLGLALLVVAGPSCRRELAGLSGQLKPWRWRLAAALGNVLAFFGFYMLCGWLLEGSRPMAVEDRLLMTAWGFAGLAAVAFWGLAVLPARLWITLFRRCAASLAAGMAVGVAAYAAGAFTADLWETRSRTTLEWVWSLLCRVYPYTVCLPARRMVGTASFLVEISRECSGFEAIGLCAVFMAAALWMLRRDFRFPQALLLLPLGLALMWLANVLRITALVALGSQGHHRLAVQGFHSLAGWVFFFGAGLALIACARRLPVLSRARPTARQLRDRDQ